jgi:transcriptional regulator with XRE-family HTH domain
MLGLSQENLAESLGVTFQQLQKYERGANRISASRLHQLAKALDVPITYFFEEFPGEGTKSAKYSREKKASEQLYTSETLGLLKLYYSVQNSNKRRELVKIMRSMIETMKA